MSRTHTSTSSPDYTSFMVRLWREKTSGQEWLIQVEHIPSGEKQHFNSLDSLFTYIRTQVSEATNEEVTEAKDG